MASVLSAGWRAAIYCLHPRVIALSLLPVLLAGGLAALLAHLYWATALDFARLLLDGLPWLTPLFDWLAPWDGGAVRAALAPLLVLALAVPLVLVSALLLVSAFMGGAIVELVARRRFPALARRHGGHWTVSIGRSLACTALALLALLVTLPLWLIPPLALLLPPLIWGWLSMVLMSYDALAEHASAAERRTLMREHRVALWAIGLITGYLGAAPSLVWAGGVLFLPMMPLLLPVFVWLYTLVFAFASAWFAHYTLAALAELRARTEGELLDPVMPPPAGAARPAALSAPPSDSNPLPPIAP